MERTAISQMIPMPQALLASMLICASAAFLYMKWGWFDSYGYTSDVFSYSRALANTLNGRFMWDPTHAFVFGNHAYLLLLLFLPFYLFFDTAFVLIASSVVAHALAAVMVLKLSETLRAGKWTSALLAACYFANPLLLEQVLMPLYGFQPDVWAPALVFSALYFYFAEKVWLSAFSLILLASVKEEFALLGVGLVAFLALDYVYERLMPRLAVGAGLPGRRGIRGLLLLGCVTTAALALSLGVLVYAKIVSEFSYAPSLSAGEAIRALSFGALGEAFDHLKFYSSTMAFGSFLCPELVVTVLARIMVNFQVYQPHTPEMMSIGSGPSWGNVSVVNLLFLGLIVGVKRAASHVQRSWRLVIPVLVGVIVWNVCAVMNPSVLGFESAIRVWIAHRESADVEAIRNLQESVRAGKAILDQTVSASAIVLISPELFKDFHDRNAVVFGFAKNTNPKLLKQATGAVLRNRDAQNIAFLRESEQFGVAYEDRNVTVLKRQESGAT